MTRWKRLPARPVFTGYDVDDVDDDDDDDDAEDDDDDDDDDAAAAVLSTAPTSTVRVANMDEPQDEWP